MIISVKESKLDKVDRNLFKIVSVDTNPLDDESIFNMSELIPPSTLLMQKSGNQIGKKKFLKKYKKYIETKDTNIEYTIFSIGMALANKQNICLTARDETYKLGYVEVLAEYLSSLFSIEYRSLKDIKDDIKMEYEGYSKKERKLIKTDDDELSEKKLKLKNKIIKTISKSIRSGMDEDGKEVYSSMERKFAIDQMGIILIKGEVAKVDKKTYGFKDIKPEKLAKTKPYIESIFVACNESKKVKKIVKSVLESHGIKFKKKAFKKLDTLTFISLFGEIYGKLMMFRSNTDSE